MVKSLAFGLLIVAIMSILFAVVAIGNSWELKTLKYLGKNA